MTRPARRRRPDPLPRSAADRGRLGEDRAAAHLRQLGYRIVARNLRTRGAELDIVVRRRRLLVAVEVKTRSDHPAPERLVDDTALRRLDRALRRLAPHLAPRCRRLRVDVVAVRLAPDGAVEIRHFPGEAHDLGPDGDPAEDLAGDRDGAI